MEQNVDTSMPGPAPLNSAFGFTQTPRMFIRNMLCRPMQYSDLCVYPSYHKSPYSKSFFNMINPLFYEYIRQFSLLHIDAPHMQIMSNLMRTSAHNSNSDYTYHVNIADTEQKSAASFSHNRTAGNNDEAGKTDNRSKETINISK